MTSRMVKKVKIIIYITYNLIKLVWEVNLAKIYIVKNIN